MVEFKISVIEKDIKNVHEKVIETLCEYLLKFEFSVYKHNHIESPKIIFKNKEEIKESSEYQQISEVNLEKTVDGFRQNLPTHYISNSGLIHEQSYFNKLESNISTLKKELMKFTYFFAIRYGKLSDDSFSSEKPTFLIDTKVYQNNHEKYVYPSTIKIGSLNINIKLIDFKKQINAEIEIELCKPNLEKEHLYNYLTENLSKKFDSWRTI